MARGSRSGKAGDLPESNSGRLARKLIEAYLNEGLDEVEQSLDAAVEGGSMSLLLASVMLHDESINSEVWDRWLKMGYLEAVRDAVAQSLESLDPPAGYTRLPSRTVH